jgi:ribosomal protein S18 acetylase RimI-like enzyme
MYEITMATPDDAAEICIIRDEAWIDTYPNEELRITKENIQVNARGLNGEFVPRRINWLKEKIANNGDNWIAYVGKDDGAVRGFVIASINDGNRRHINSLYVMPGYQSKGLGKILMQKALEWLGNSEDIYLEVTSYNHIAIHFYELFGFIKTDNIVEEEQGRPPFITPIPQAEMVRRAKSY